MSKPESIIVQVVLATSTLLGAFNLVNYLRLLRLSRSWGTVIMSLCSLLCICVALLGLRLVGIPRIPTAEVHMRVVYVIVPVLLITCGIQALALLLKYDRIMSSIKKGDDPWIRLKR
jgi:hypothetical protein